ncbi:metal ABC transporter substrate-binding protein [Deinococcus aquaedulcis]|uniref:metal ABC transporter substrate-binding protein n=1 Tax=Deinococcus aquaedulcis TaxID=2840455 RepID=UPI001C83C097|nr:metal ABC transporter substrate-binding protein [Deinococcus aquaedulcis]
MAALSLGSADARRLKVMVSFHPLYDVVARVAGGAADVQRAAPAGSSPHTFDPTVQDIARIRAADLAVMAGLGADDWLDRYVQASGSRARVLKLGHVMAFARLRAGRAVDPHWWLDASLMAQAARRTGQELAALDPAHAATYRAAAEREATSLLDLHRELQTTLRPIRGARLVTFHNAFGYFARAYGLTIAATLAPLEGIEPSAARLAEAVRTIRAQGVRAVFAEPQLPPGPARTVAAESGVPLFTLDPEGSAASPTYAAMMRANRDTLLRALR